MCLFHCTSCRVNHTMQLHLEMELPVLPGTSCSAEFPVPLNFLLCPELPIPLNFLFRKG
jgi:hypothetical protein